MSAWPPAACAPSAARKTRPAPTPWRWKKSGAPPATGYTEAITEFHIVGGLHADLPFQYYVDLIAGLKERFPQVHLKAFTMVEIAFFSKIGKMTPREVLIKFKEAGLDSMPGGGAEIFSDRIRHIICDHKIDGDDWLETRAHRA